MLQEINMYHLFIHHLFIHQFIHHFNNELNEIVLVNFCNITSIFQFI